MTGHHRTSYRKNTGQKESILHALVFTMPLLGKKFEDIGIRDIFSGFAKYQLEKQNNRFVRLQMSHLLIHVTEKIRPQLQ